MNKNYFKSSLIASAILLPALSFSQTTDFTYTGAQQFYVVPACVTQVELTAYAAQGADATIGGIGGLGGMTYGVMDVTPGDTLFVFVGGQDGYNGGGQGGQDGNSAGGGAAGAFAAIGGGASDIRLNGILLTDRVMVAGAGGGAGSNGVWTGCQVAGPAGNGGDGGITATIGTVGIGTPCNCQGGGGDTGAPGTLVAGGIAGSYAGNTACLRATWTIGQDGSLGFGGDGSLTYHNGTGGGGGGGAGYYGGGSGGSGSDTTPGGGGGGGSSFLGVLTATVDTTGINSGDGSASISVLTMEPGLAATSNISGSSEACDGDTLTYSISSLIGATTYNWVISPGYTILTGQGDTLITVLVVNTGSGTVNVTASNDCSSSDAPDFEILPSGCLGIDDKNNGVLISLYPNPSNGTFNIIAKDFISNADIVIIDQQGKTVYQKNNISLIQGEIFEISLDNLSNGIYTVSLKANNITFNERLSIIK
jgi:hypothetical protein